MRDAAYERGELSQEFMGYQKGVNDIIIEDDNNRANIDLCL